MPSLFSWYPMQRIPITLDGLTPDQILAMADQEIDALILCAEPLVFRAGTAEVLGQFWIEEQSLVLELCQIEGGGEGVLPTVAILAERYATRRNLNSLDWRVHAIHCAKPNLKLRRVLERKGFVITQVPSTGECFRKIQPLKSVS